MSKYKSVAPQNPDEYDILIMQCQLVRDAARAQHLFDNDLDVARFAGHPAEACAMLRNRQRKVARFKLSERISLR